MSFQLGDRVWWIDERNFLRQEALSGHVAKVHPFGVTVDRDLPNGKRYVMNGYIFGTEAEAWRALAASKRKDAECALSLAAEFDARAEAAESRAIALAREAGR